MELYKPAVEYLSKNILKNCGLLQVIKRGSAQIIAAGGDGVLLYDTVCQAYMASAADTPDMRVRLQTLPNPREFFLTDNTFLACLKTLYPFEHTLECDQLVYDRGRPLDYPKRLEIRKPTDDEMRIVLKHYRRMPAWVVEEIRARGDLYVGSEGEGKIVGFIGCHLEGSMGLLEILPKYRRMGYGTELESFMINRLLERGLIPFGHVVTGNSKSLRLQKKLGLTKAPEKVYWLY